MLALSAVKPNLNYRLGRSFDDARGARVSRPVQSFIALGKCYYVSPNASFIKHANYFISRCQLEDWKNGLPVPHKTICGKKQSGNSLILAS